MRIIVMLTHNDVTVSNAIELFEEHKDLPIEFWGFKDVGLANNDLKKLVNIMKKANKKTFLEVVRYSEAEGLESVNLAIESGFDYLLGTIYYNSIRDLIKKSEIKYFPFCGRIYGHPSVLDGSIEDIVKDAKKIESMGVDGFDVLTYRYTGDPNALIKEIIKEIKVPIVSAGSISSFDRIKETVNAKVWAYTIGGAFFDKKFIPNGSYRDNVMAAYEYTKNINSF